MISHARIETFSSNGYDTLKRRRGERVKVHYARMDGLKFSKSGVIVSIDMRNISLEVESGNIFQIPLSALTKVVFIGSTITMGPAVATKTDSLSLCLACRSCYLSEGMVFCTANLDMESSVTDSTICGGFENGRDMPQMSGR